MIDPKPEVASETTEEAIPLACVPNELTTELAAEVMTLPTAEVSASN